MTVADNGHLRRMDVRLPVHHCRDCDVFFLNPPPPAAVGREYFAEAYAGQARGNIYYDDGFKERTSQLRLQLLSGYGTPGQKLLDIGCGKGQFVAVAHRAGWDAWGVELDEGACAYAADHFGLQTVLNGDLSHPGLPAEFDVVTLWDVIEHVPDPVGLFREIAARLRPGGLVIVRTANVRSWAFDRHRAQWWAFGSDHRFYFSPGSLSVAMKAAELTVKDVLDRERAERPDKRRSGDISETGVAAGLRSLSRSPAKIVKVERYARNLVRRLTGQWRYGNHYQMSIMTIVGAKSPGDSHTVSMTPAVEADRVLPGGLPRVTYISWAESCSRSDHTARELGGRSHMVYATEFGSRLSTVLLKYVVQWRRTARILAEEQPEAVFVMTPPLFAAVPAFWYAWRHQKRIVLDAHSAAFLHPRWRFLQWLQRAMCRRAATTLVHNEHIASLVRTAGGHTTLVPDVPIQYTRREAFPRPAGFTVAVVCSFNADEPIDSIFDAAAALPDVQFLLTGNPRYLARNLAARRPSNVQLTGFLSTADYGGLLTCADVVLSLTTRDHTMLRGAYEAIYQGTPVIVSNWPVLREAFPEGAAHVDNTPGQIAAAIKDVQARIDEYRAGAQRQRELRLVRWTATRRTILNTLNASMPDR